MTEPSEECTVCSAMGTIRSETDAESFVLAMILTMLEKHPLYLCDTHRAEIERRLEPPS
jgi:hypothetical protein